MPTATNSPAPRLKLPKACKLCSSAAIDALFASGKGALAYPLRVVYMPAPNGGPTQFFVSVPKKRVRRAVGRVAVRRRVREAYRLNRALLAQAPPLALAFLYVANSPLPFAKIEAAMRRLLSLLAAHEPAESHNS